MDDLISRRVVIDMLSKQLDYLDMLDKYDNPTAVSQWYGINWARNRIADLPSVQPERQKGKWRHYEGMYFCEICHSALDDKSPFCPMCGTDMRGKWK